MAIFHLDVKTIKRSDGRSSIAAAAYRAGARLIDRRTGFVSDYRKRSGVVKSFLALPDEAPKWANLRGKLWNAAEESETRKNSTVAREWLVALPNELDAAAREKLVRDFAAELVERYGVAVDCAIHAPSKLGSQKNHHAHILTSTRALGADGFGAKTRVLDAAKTGGVEIRNMREWWSGRCNQALEEAGSGARIDHRTKAEVAAAARREAEAARQEIERIEATNDDANSLSALGKGFSAFAKQPSLFFLSTAKGELKIEELRRKVRRLTATVERMSKPIQFHRGPQTTAILRRIEAQREAAKIAARQRTAEMAERRRQEAEDERARKRSIEEQKREASRKKEVKARERKARNARNSVSALQGDAEKIASKLAEMERRKAAQIEPEEPDDEDDYDSGPSGPGM